MVSILAQPGTRGGIRVQGLVPVRGVLGRGRPKLASHEFPVAAGDVLIMTTDGVEAHYQHELPLLQPLDRAAEAILKQFGNPADEALVVMLRYRGRPA